MIGQKNPLQIWVQKLFAKMFRENAVPGITPLALWFIYLSLYVGKLMYNDPIGHTIVPTNRKNKWQLEIDIKYQLKFIRQLYSVMFMERCTSKVTGIKIYQ